MSHNPKLYTERLRKRLIAWKQEINASYADIDNIIGGKGKAIQFCSGKQNIGYEFGKMVEELIKWDKDTYFNYKMLEAKSKNVNKS